jgi:hypothetical protein
MGLFSSIANLFGASKVKKASREAANAQIGYAQQGIDLLAGQRADLTQRFDASQAGVDQAIGGLQPFADSGVSAALGINGLLGLEGADAQATALAQLQNSPLFASLFGNGQEAVLQSAAATGGLRGGNVQRSLADFGSDLFAQIIQQQMQNLTGVADRGANAAGNILTGRTNQTGAVLNYGLQDQANAQQQAGLYGQQGQAKAGGIQGAAKGSLMKYGAVGDIANQVVSAIAGMPAGGLGGLQGVASKMVTFI